MNIIERNGAIIIIQYGTNKTLNDNVKEDREDINKRLLNLVPIQNRKTITGPVTEDKLSEMLDFLNKRGVM